MPQIGNDIVDLKQTDNLNASRDSRFPIKVLTAAEIEFVRGAQNPARLLWAFWACKEAAYKVTRKIRSDASFLPRLWQVVMYPPEALSFDGEVLIPEEEKVYVRVFLHDDYVHSIGAESKETLQKIICGVEPLEENARGAGEGASAFARECLKRRLATCLHFNYADLEIKRKKGKDGLGPPRLQVGGKKSPVDVSLSHDGCFAAWSFVR